MPRLLGDTSLQFQLKSKINLHVTYLNNSENMFKTNAWKNGENMLFWVILAWICFLYSCFSLQSPPKLSLVKVDHLLIRFFDARGNFAPRIRCWATKQTKTALFSKPSLWVSMLVFRERKIPNLHFFGVLAISLSGGVVTKSWISRLGYPASEG